MASEDLHILPEEDRPSEESLRLMNLELERRVEEKTREIIAHESRFRALVEHGMEAISLLDRDLNFLYRSPASERLTGWTMEERQELGIAGMTHPEDMEQTRALYRTVLANPGVPYRLTFRTMHRDGRYISVDGSIINLLNDESVQAIVTNTHDVSDSRAAENLLKESHEELRMLASHLQDVREQERTSMAREIHDELGQQLTGLKMDLSWLNKRPDLNEPSARKKIKDILSLVDETVNTVRRLAAELRPAILDDLGLPEALEWHCKQFQERSGVSTTLDIKGSREGISPDTVTGLFRICQEALTNVARHSDATKVSVLLQVTEKVAMLSILDNGKGFDVTSVQKKNTLGILGMKERSLMMGGKYEYRSEPGLGTTIRVSVPLERDLVETK